MKSRTVIDNLETRFDRSAWLLLLVALLFLSLNLTQIAYRFTLPTEGWLVSDDDNGKKGMFFLFVRTWLAPFLHSSQAMRSVLLEESQQLKSLITAV